tara:strand:+ start:3483 stop:3608 length:126 start_codon:yes stop_codon:yes gene_type:complete
MEENLEGVSPMLKHYKKADYKDEKKDKNEKEKKEEKNEKKN